MTTTTPTRAAAIAALQAAIDSYEGDTGPGTWFVMEDLGGRNSHCIGLEYQLYDEDEPRDEDGECTRYGDEPWTKWGGNAILSAAGLTAEAGMLEECEDYGGKYLSDWAPIEVSDEDEEE